MSHTYFGLSLFTILWSIRLGVARTPYLSLPLSRAFPLLLVLALLCSSFSRKILNLLVNCTILAVSITTMEAKKREPLSPVYLYPFCSTIPIAVVASSVLAKCRTFRPVRNVVSLNSDVKCEFLIWQTHQWADFNWNFRMKYPIVKIKNLKMVDLVPYLFILLACSFLSMLFHLLATSFTHDVEKWHLTFSWRNEFRNQTNTKNMPIRPEMYLLCYERAFYVYVHLSQRNEPNEWDICITFST